MPPNSRHPVVALAVPFLALAALSLLRPASAAEPVYRITLPDGSALRATLEVGSASDGGRWARVRAATPRTAARRTGTEATGRSVDAALTLDAAGNAVRSRTETRSPEGIVSLLEAERNAGGWTARVPEQSGTLAAGAPVISSLDALAFLGRRYDWKRGGPQTFVLLLDFLPELPRLATMTLEAAGTETLDLPDAEVRARRLKITTDLPRPAGQKDPGPGYVHVGPMGEALRFSTTLLPLPLEIRGPARVENGGMVLRFGGPLPLVVRAVRLGSVGLTVKLEGPNAMELSSVSTDAAYRPQRVTHQLRGRPYTADITPNEVRWRLAAGRAEPLALTGAPWFLPHYLATEFWEKSPAYAAASPGQKVPGTYLPLELAGTNGLPFEAENRGTTTIAGPDGARAALRHWRLTFAERAADLWTDGARLVKLAASDGMIIVRENWTEAAAGLRAPEAPRPAPPAEPTQPTVEPGEPVEIIPGPSHPDSVEPPAPPEP